MIRRFDSAREEFLILVFSEAITIRIIAVSLFMQRDDAVEPLAGFGKDKRSSML